MLDKMTYINHLGEVISFGVKGLYINYSDVRDYTWSFDSTNNKISNINKGVVTKQLPFIISTQLLDNSAWDVRNKMYNVADKDIKTGTKGTLYIGELTYSDVQKHIAGTLYDKYYLNCYINSISNSNFLINDNYMTGTIGICTDDPYWHCKTLKTIEYSPYEQELVNDYIDDSDFIATMYGDGYAPYFTINNNLYGLNTVITSGEKVVINTLNKTIVGYDEDENMTNMFDKRIKESSIFKKIPSGSNSIIWTGRTTLEIVLIDNRSEPKWGV